MPRAGVLALGAVAAAWVSPAIGASTTLLLVACLVLILAGMRSIDRAGMATVLLPAVIGFALIAIRLAPAALGDATAAAVVLPDDRGPWTFVVEVVGSPRDGH